MRVLGFFPSDYEIECLHHELHVCGKRKVQFEDLVKLYINHSHSSLNGSQKSSLETSLKHFFDSSQTATSEDIVIKKSDLISILTESAEKIDEKDADLYLKQIFRGGNENFVEEISLSNFMQQIMKININSGCIA
jgi:Ca2+-binding EF-hand superfamily protein